MARIDLAALKRASEGDQTKKVTVSKAWLRAVHDELNRKSNMDTLAEKLGNLGDKLYGLRGK